MVSTKKLILTAPDATIIRHKCTLNGCIPHKAKVQKIWDWPECQNLTQVHRFLGVCYSSFSSSFRLTILSYLMSTYLER